MDTTPSEFIRTGRKEENKKENKKGEKEIVELDLRKSSPDNDGIAEELARKRRKRAKRFRDFIKRKKELREKKKSTTLFCGLKSEKIEGTHHSEVRHEAKISLVEESEAQRVLNEVLCGAIDDVNKQLETCLIFDEENFPKLKLYRSVASFPLGNDDEEVDIVMEKTNEKVKGDRSLIEAAIKLSKQREEEKQRKLELANFRQVPPPLERNSPSLGTLQAGEPMVGDEFRWTDLTQEELEELKNYKKQAKLNEGEFNVGDVNDEEIKVNRYGVKYDPEVRSDGWESLDDEEAAQVKAVHRKLNLSRMLYNSEMKIVQKARERDEKGSLMIDSLIALLTATVPVYSETGVSDVVLFARGVLFGSRSFACIRLACLNFGNALNARYGSTFIKSNLEFFGSVVLGWVDKYIKPLGDNYASDWGIFQVEGEKIESEEKKEEGFKSYVEKCTSLMNEYLVSEKGLEFPKLPEWKDEWNEQMMNLKHSSLFYAVMELVKNATTLFMLLSFLDKDRAKEMLDMINTKSWYKSIKILGASALTIMGLLAICKEINKIRARALAGEPLFGDDLVLCFHKELNEIIESSGLIPTDIKMSEDGKTIANTKNSIRLRALKEKIRSHEIKIAQTMKPDERAQLVAINKKMLIADKLCLESYAACNKRRKQPYAMTFMGAPGIGKTILVGMVHEFTGMLLGLPTGNEYMYVKNFASKYDDMFKAFMWHVSFDDFGQVKPNMVQAFAAAIFAPIAYNNTTDNPAVKAVAEEKDKYLIHPKILTFTANSPREAIKAVVVDEFAILRRMGPVVFPVITKYFRSEADESQLDYAKFAACMASDDWSNGYPWIFQIGKYYRNKSGFVAMQFLKNDGSNSRYVSLAGEELTDETIFTFPQYFQFVKMELKRHQQMQAIEFHLSAEKCAQCGEPLLGHSAICDKEIIKQYGFVQAGLPEFSGLAGLSDEFLKSLIQRSGVVAYGCRERVRDLQDRTIPAWRSKVLRLYNDKCPEVVDPIRRYMGPGLPMRDIYSYYRYGDRTMLERGILLTKRDYICLSVLYWILYCVVMLRDSFSGITGVMTVSMYALILYNWYLNLYFSIFVMFVLCIHFIITFTLVRAKRYSDKFLIKICDSIEGTLFRGKLDNLTLMDVAKAYLPAEVESLMKFTKAVALVSSALFVYKLSGFLFNGKKEGLVQLTDTEKYSDYVSEKPERFKDLEKKNLSEISQMFVNSDIIFEDETKEIKEKLRNHWNCLKMAAATAAVAVYAKKSKYPEATLKEMMQSMCYIAKITSLEDKTLKCLEFSAYRYKESMYIPRHGLNYWKYIGAFGKKGYAKIEFLSIVPGFNRPNVSFQARFDDFVGDEFDFAAIRVSQFWGPLAKKYDELYWDVEEDFNPYLVGMKGLIFAPCRNEFMELKFRHSANYKVALAPHVNGFIFKEYTNPRNVNIIDYEVLSTQSRNGDCHSPVIAINKQGVPLIVGVHTQLYIDKNTKIPVGGAYVISRKMLDRLNDKAVANSKLLSVPILPTTRVEIEGPMHEKSILNTREVDANILVVGKSVCNVRPNSESRVQPTKVIDKFKSWLDETGVEYGAPRLKAGLVDGVWVDPNNKPLEAYDVKGPEIKPFPMHTFRAAAKDLAEDIFKGLEKHKEVIDEVLQGRTVLSMADTINGVEDGKFIPPINLKTSAGSEWPGGKMAWLDVDDVETAKRKRPCYKLKPEVQDFYDRQWNEVRNDESLGVTFTAQAKDEVRVAKKSARIFYMMQLTDMLRHRSVFAVLQYLLRLDRHTSENYIGLNCSSISWKHLYDHLKRKGKRGTDKDFRQFDVNQKRDMRLVVLDEIWLALGRWIGYSEDEMDMLSKCGIEDCFAYTWMAGEVFLSPGNNNSGSVKTSDDNCLMNSILHRCAWMDAVEKATGVYYVILFRRFGKKYQTFCALADFGDDSSEGIDERVVKIYNFKTFKDYFSQFGIEVTPSKKTDGDYETKPIEDLEFLKRTFKPTTIKHEDKDYEIVLAPLELSSIYKPLCYQVASKSVPSEVQTISAISSVNRELWMHGKDLFELRRPTLIEALVELGDHSGLETFDDITKLYIEGNFVTENT